MAETRPRLLQDFLIPHLNQETFTDKLFWVDRNEGIFRIFWRHQSSSKFCPEDSRVFKAWAIAKRLWDPNDEKSPTKAKQRIRAALLKLKSVRCLDREGEYRTYKIVSKHDALRDINNRYDYNIDFHPEDYLEEEHERFIDELLRTPSSYSNLFNEGFAF